MKHVANSFELFVVDGEHFDLLLLLLDAFSTATPEPVLISGEATFLHTLCKQPILLFVV